MSLSFINQQKNTLRIAVITADAPVSDGVLAWGMHPINARLLKALDPSLGIIFVSNARLDDIEPQLQKKCVLINRPFIFKVIRKLARLIFGGRMCNAGFRFILPRLVRQLKEVKADWVFCPCDSNPFDFERAVLLARMSQLPLAIYIVDDFIEGSKHVGIQERLRSALKDVPGWIRSVNRVFVISEGFRIRFKDLYGIDAKVLPFPYEPGGRVEVKKDGMKDHQIIFVGNLSYFYAGGVKAMARVLDELNQTREVPFVLRLTLPDMQFVKKVIGDFKCIQCVPCQGLDDLKSEIAASLMAFVPYSFDPKYKIMTQTSFPSKILPCLAAGRYVLVYGPEDSSSVRYFVQHGLGEIVSEEDPGLLRDIVLRQEKLKVDHGEKYRQVIRQEHDPQKVAQELLAGLNVPKLIAK